MTPNPIVISLCRHSSFKKSLNGEQWIQSKERDYTKSKDTIVEDALFYAIFGGDVLNFKRETQNTERKKYKCIILSRQLRQ